MSLLTSIVDLACIKVKPENAGFDPKLKAPEIEAIAHSIVELKGLVRIPLVRVLGIDEYELVDGFLEYYAYLEARKINSELPDRITTFVIKPSNERAILEQVRVNQKVSQIQTSQESSQADIRLDLKIENMESRIDSKIENIESGLDRNFEKLSLELRRFKDELIALISSRSSDPIQLPVQEVRIRLDPIDAFNQILDDSVREQILANLTNIKGPTMATKIVRILQECRRNGHEFSSIDDIHSSIGKRIIARERLLELFAKWKS